MANHRHFSDSDISKLMEASDWEKEDISEYENHTIVEIEIESSVTSFDIDIQPVHNIQSN